MTTEESILVIHSQSTTTGLTIGVAVGGALGGALITMAATLLVVVIVNARRRNRIKGQEAVYAKPSFLRDHIRFAVAVLNIWTPPPLPIRHDKNFSC